MKKILYISNIGGTRMTGSFAGASWNASKKLGMAYHSLANRDKTTPEQMKLDAEKFGIVIHHADIQRSPFSLKNWKALRQTIAIIKREKIDYIHCNTPVGGIIGRLAGRFCGVKKIIYQAHGFHFYKGSSKVDWLVYYPIERIMAHMTDAIITMNQEDYDNAQRFRLRKHGRVFNGHGVGVNLSRFSDPGTREEKRKELGLQADDIAAISAGDLIERKNYEVAIRAVAEANNSHLHYFICGQGPLREKLEAAAKELGVEKQIHFLGFRSDMNELMHAADIFLFTTLQEGMPRSMMEAMACGLPCIASRIRGNVDLLKDEKGGILCGAKDVGAFAQALSRLTQSPELRAQMREENLRVIQDYDVNVVEQELMQIYREVLN